MLIGRESEKKIINDMILSKKAEFMAVYGRRRIGKTFLIRDCCSNNNCFYVEITGVKDGKLKKQLGIFTKSLAKFFYGDALLKEPTTWEEAFERLTNEIKKITGKKIVVFFDELPWMATKRSRLIQALDYYWNTSWSKINNCKIIVCGSAASWILDNLINAKGGLHNRLTKTLLLKPFDLRTTKLFLEANGHKLNEKQVLDTYMAIGGIPFYLEQLQPALSVNQNINNICFGENGLLREEFPRLFKSLFNNAEIISKIIKAIASKRYGMSREELLSKIKSKSGVWINDRIEELESAGFITRFIPYGYKKDVHYRIIDEYTMFYLKWIAPEIKQGYGFSKSHWLDVSASSATKSWFGYAFENVCFKHLEQIKKALGLENIHCNVASWKLIPKKGENIDGAQIDLLFDRADNSITLCEIKYTETGKFRIDKDYAKNLLNKIDVFASATKTKKQIFLAIISIDGIEKNLYANDLVQHEVKLRDLF